MVEIFVLTLNQSDLFTGKLNFKTLTFQFSINK